MGAAFAQQKAPAAPAAAAKAPPVSNAFGVDVFQLFKGIIAADKDVTNIFLSAGYEHLVASHLSFGADLDFHLMMFDDINAFYFSLAAEGRYYPSADFDKLFVGTTLGFNVMSVDGETKPENGGFMGLVTSLKMGYKAVLTKSFYMEPSLSYVLSKSSMFGLPTPQGWQGGLRLGFVF